MPSGWPTWASSTPRTSWSTPVGSSMWPTSCTATTMSGSPRARGIGRTTTRLFQEAEEYGVNPLVAAERLAQRRIDERRAELAGR